MASSFGQSIGPIPAKGSQLSYDLHGASVKKAKETLDEIFTVAEKEKLQSVTLITGVGKHSKNNYSVLYRKTVPEFLEQPEIKAKISQVKRDYQGAYEVVFKRDDTELEKAKTLMKRLAPFIFPNQEFSAIKERAEAGSVEDQFNLYVRYTEGYGVPKNPEEGVVWLKKAAAAGHSYSQTQLGLMYDIGMVVKQSYKKAVQWHTRAAEKNEPLSLFTLGSYYFLGRAVVRNDELALHYLSRAADLNDPQAAYNLGAILLYGCDGISADPVRANPLLKQAVKAGFVFAAVMLGKQYFFGWGIPINYSESRRFFLMAEKDPVACYYLGRIHSEGLGVDPNDKTAFEWFQKSADLGDLDAQKNIACIQIQGGPIPQNFRAGWKKLKELAAAGHHQSAGALGLFFLQGVKGTVQRDQRLAIQYLTQAAEGGDHTSQQILPSLLLSQEKPDFIAAERWQRAAASRGDPEDLFALAMFLERSSKAGSCRAEILDCYERAAEKNFAKAEFFLGLSYIEGDIVEKDEKRGIELIERAAKHGLSLAQCEMGCHLIRSESEEDHTRAVSFFTSAALQNNSEAMYNLAMCYRYGRGITASPKQFEFWMEKSAHLKYPEALFEMGCIETNRGQDQKAFDHFLEAAKKGHPRAQRNTAVSYLKAQGIERDLKQGIYWLEESLKDQSEAIDEYRLGCLYTDPAAGAVNVPRAIHWLTQSMLHGLEHAAHALAQYPNPEGRELALQALKRAAPDHPLAVRALLYVALERDLILEKPIVQRAEQIEPFLLAALWHKRKRDRDAKVLLDRLSPTCEDAEMQFRISVLYLQMGHEKEALPLLERASLKNHPEATWMVAAKLTKEIEQQPSLRRKAFDLWLKAANLNITEAQLFVSRIYLKGDWGIPVNLPEGTRFTLLAAEAGNEDAIGSIGLLYFHQNHPDAIKWLLRGAEIDDPDAIFFLATSYQEGKGVAKSMSEACKWYRKGAALQHAPSQTQLARLLLEGAPGTYNLKEVIDLLNEAVKQDFADAEFSLGHLYFYNSQDPATRAAGIHLLERAALHGSVEAESLLRELRTPPPAPEEEQKEDVFHEVSEPEEESEEKSHLPQPPPPSSSSCAIL